MAADCRAEPAPRAIVGQPMRAFAQRVYVALGAANSRNEGCREFYEGVRRAYGADADGG